VAELPMAVAAVVVVSEIGFYFLLRIWQTLLLLLWHQQQVPQRPIQQVLPVAPPTLVLIFMHMVELAARAAPSAAVAVAVEQPLLVV